MKKYNIKIRTLTEAWKFRPPSSLETSEKKRKAMLGHTHTEETKQKMRKGHLGKKVSLETREKMSLKAKGRYREKSNPMFGKNHTEEAKNKITEKLKEWHKKNPDIQKGQNNHRWKGGSSTFRMMIRRSKEYKNWLKAVFRRDHYICVKCGNRGSGNLNAHHILSWADYPEERFDIENGLTLCVNCHREIHG